MSLILVCIYCNRLETLRACVILWDEKSNCTEDFFSSPPPLLSLLPRRTRGRGMHHVVHSALYVYCWVVELLVSPFKYRVTISMKVFLLSKCTIRAECFALSNSAMHTIALGKCWAVIHVRFATSVTQRSVPTCHCIVHCVTPSRLTTACF